MNSLHEWEFTVPDDGDALMAELRRHGVEPGQRLRVSVIDAQDGLEDVPVPAFFDSFDGPPDLAERSSEILAAEFPGDW